MEGESGEKEKNSTKHSCKTCGKLFKKKNALLIHERIHTGEKPHECDNCKKSFTQKGNLVKHKLIHTGEKPYACDICEKTFSDSSTLARHKRIHTGEKPYSCDICEKTFSESSTLAKHKRIHTGEIPYKCNICQKSFSQSSSLSLHCRTASHLKRNEIKNKSTSNTNHFVDCGETIKVEDIKEDINEEESVENPLAIQHDMEIDTYYLNNSITSDSKNSTIINVDVLNLNNAHEENNLLDNVEINNKNEEVNNVMDNIEENVNEVEGNVVGQGRNNFPVLKNLSVEEALAFFSS